MVFSVRSAGLICIIVFRLSPQIDKNNCKWLVFTKIGSVYTKSIYFDIIWFLKKSTNCDAKKVFGISIGASFYLFIRPVPRSVSKHRETLTKIIAEMNSC